MITRRCILAAVGAASLPLPAVAKTGDTPLPPPLFELGALPLVRTDGASVTLGSETGVGRAAMVSLWATWCGPCVDEARHLSKLRTKYAPEKLAILGINVDKAPDEKKVAAFFRRGNVNYTQLRGDPEGVYLAFRGSLPITLPRLYIFTPAGLPAAVFGRYSGGATLRQVDKAVEAAMNATAS